jgi:hypothetical protein
MNRVYPLREGSGECDALTEFDAPHPCEFRSGREIISFEIISLLNEMYRLRHTLSLAGAVRQLA